MEFIVKKNLEEAEYEAVLYLLLDSFKHYLNEGIHFSICDLTIDTLKENTQKYSFILTYIDSTLVAVRCYTIKQTILGLCAHGKYLAISNAYKRKGIASQMQCFYENHVRALGCKYVLADTAVTATESVLWHKKNGYKIILLRSHKSTNFYSYFFVKTISGKSIWKSSVWCSFIYVLSFLFCKLTKHKDGSLTICGRIFDPIKSMLQKRLFSS